MKKKAFAAVAALTLPFALFGCGDSAASAECQEKAVQYSDAMNQVGSLQRKAEEADAAYTNGTASWEEYRAAVDATRENSQLMTTLLDEMFAECGSGFASDVVEGKLEDVLKNN